MKYHAKINFPDTNFFDENGSFLFCVRKKREYYFIGTLNKAVFVDVNENILFEFEYKTSFLSRRFSKFKTIKQNFKNNVEVNIIDGKLHLYFNENDIFINDKNKIIGFYEGKIILNGNEIAEIKEVGNIINPKTIYNFDFFTTENINFYCLILFAIHSIEFRTGD